MQITEHLSLKIEVLNDILKTSITNERERYSNYVDEKKTKEFKYFFHLIFM